MALKQGHEDSTQRGDSVCQHFLTDKAGKLQIGKLKIWSCCVQFADIDILS